MLDLFLIRHAKSEWRNASGEDLKRDISPLGIEQTRIIGEYMKKKGLKINEILCSPSLRTRQTSDIILEFLVQKPKVRIVDDLYFAFERSIFETVIEKGNEKSTMMISHEPLLSDSIDDFSNDRKNENYLRAREKFPTSGLFYIKFNAKKWHMINRRNSKIISFIRPRDLMG